MKEMAMRSPKQRTVDFVEGILTAMKGALTHLDWDFRRGSFEACVETIDVRVYNTAHAFHHFKPVIEIKVIDPEMEPRFQVNAYGMAGGVVCGPGELQPNLWRVVQELLDKNRVRA